MDDALPCSMELYCQNSRVVSGIDSKTKCALCRLSPDNVGKDMRHYWKPTLEAKSRPTLRHPMLVDEKRQEKINKYAASLDKKRSRDPNKRKVSRLAALAEKTSEKNIIHATKNSGRQNKDGDHVTIGRITLDTKLQTTRENPIIQLAELEKVCEDAKRAGSLTGGLIIRNKHGVGCVVMKEGGFARFLGMFRELEEKVDGQQVGSEVPGVSQTDIDVVKGS